MHEARAALIENPKSVKALYRAARGFLALDRVADAKGCCDLALELDPSNQELVKLQERVSQRKERLDLLEAERAERKRRQGLENQALQMAFVSRGLWMKQSNDPPDNPMPAHFDHESLPPASSKDIPLVGALRPWKAPDPITTPVIFPVMMLYPQYNTCLLYTSPSPRD